MTKFSCLHSELHLCLIRTLTRVIRKIILEPTATKTISPKWMPIKTLQNGSLNR